MFGFLFKRGGSTKDKERRGGPGAPIDDPLGQSSGSGTLSVPGDNLRAQSKSPSTAGGTQKKKNNKVKSVSNSLTSLQIPSNNNNNENFQRGQFLHQNNNDQEDEPNSSKTSSSSSFGTLCSSKESVGVTLRSQSHGVNPNTEAHEEGSINQDEPLKQNLPLDLSSNIEFIDDPDFGFCNVSLSSKKVDELSHDEPKVADAAILCDLITERDISDAEKKGLFQLEEVRSKLLARDAEIDLLRADIQLLSTERDSKAQEIEALSTQVQKLRAENEKSLEEIQELEMELQDIQMKNEQLSQELTSNSELLRTFERGECRTKKMLMDLESKVKSLSETLLEVEHERDKIIEERDAVEIERDEEFRALQNALDDALESKIKFQNKYEHDMEALRSSCANQEQQLMDDFEWKLRQIESSCKKRITENEKQTEDKITELKYSVDKEMAMEKEKLLQERRSVEDQMRQVSHFKSYEVELIQLRGLVHEQQKALRAAARQMEQFEFNEKILQEELRAVRSVLDQEKSHLQVIQSTHQRRIESHEETLHSKLDKQRNELNAKWEDRMRAECSRLREDLCQLHAEEKHLAVESMKLQKDQEMSTSKQIWESIRKDLLQEISALKDTITEKESSAHRDIERLTVQTDREIWELRKTLDKTTSSHVEQISKLKEAHNEEIENLQAKHEQTLEKLQEVEKQLHDVETKERSVVASHLLMTSGLAAVSQSSTVNKSDSGMGGESTDEEDVDEDEDEEADDDDLDEVDDLTPDQEETFTCKALEGPATVTNPIRTMMSSE